MLKKYHKRNSLIFLIICFILMLLLIIAYQLLKIKYVDCYSQFGPCPEEINREFNHFIGTPLLKPLPKNQVKKDLANFPQIKSISLYRRLPSSLIVAISLRRPIGALGPNVLGAQVIADEEGIVFQKISQSELPTLITQVLPPISSRLSNLQRQSLLCLGLMGEIFDTQISGELDNDILTISAPNDMKVIINVAQPTSNWYTPLQLIIHRSKINAKMPHKIDLRFNNTVITY
jgi:hypothetical protein